MDRFETLLASLLRTVGARLHSICEHASENVCGIRSNAEREREGTLLMEEREGREGQMMRAMPSTRRQQCSLETEREVCHEFMNSWWKERALNVYSLFYVLHPKELLKLIFSAGIAALNTNDWSNSGLDFVLETTKEC